MKTKDEEIIEKVLDKWVVPYNRLLKREHPLLWKLNYIKLGWLYNLLRDIVPKKNLQERKYEN